MQEWQEATYHTSRSNAIRSKMSSSGRDVRMMRQRRVHTKLTEGRRYAEQNHVEQTVLLDFDRSIILLICSLAQPRNCSSVNRRLARETGRDILFRLVLEDDRGICLWHAGEEEDDLDELPDEQHSVAPPPIGVLYDKSIRNVGQASTRPHNRVKHIPSDKGTNNGTNERGNCIHGHGSAFRGQCTFSTRRCSNSRCDGSIVE